MKTDTTTRSLSPPAPSSSTEVESWLRNYGSIRKSIISVAQPDTSAPKKYKKTFWTINIALVVSLITCIVLLAKNTSSTLGTKIGEGLGIPVGGALLLFGNYFLGRKLMNEKANSIIHKKSTTDLIEMYSASKNTQDTDNTFLCKKIESELKKSKRNKSLFFGDGKYYYPESLRPNGNILTLKSTDGGEPLSINLQEDKFYLDTHKNCYVLQKLEPSYLRLTLKKELFQLLKLSATRKSEAKKLLKSKINSELETVENTLKKEQHFLKELVTIKQKLTGLNQAISESFEHHDSNQKNCLRESTGYGKKSRYSYLKRINTAIEEVDKKLNANPEATKHAFQCRGKLFFPSESQLKATIETENSTDSFLFDPGKARQVITIDEKDDLRIYLNEAEFYKCGDDIVVQNGGPNRLIFKVGEEIFKKIQQQNEGIEFNNLPLNSQEDPLIAVAKKIYHRDGIATISSFDLKDQNQRQAVHDYLLNSLNPPKTRHEPLRDVFLQTDTDPTVQYFQNLAKKIDPNLQIGETQSDTKLKLMKTTESINGIRFHHDGQCDANIFYCAQRPQDNTQFRSIFCKAENPLAIPTDAAKIVNCDEAHIHQCVIREGDICIFNNLELVHGVSSGEGPRTLAVALFNKVQPSS